MLPTPSPTLTPLRGSSLLPRKSRCPSPPSSTESPRPDARTSLDSPSPVLPRVRPERSVMPMPRPMPPSCTPDTPVTTDTVLDTPDTPSVPMPVTTATPTALDTDATMLPVSPFPVPERGVMLMRRRPPPPLPPLPLSMPATPSVLAMLDTPMLVLDMPDLDMLDLDIPMLLPLSRSTSLRSPRSNTPSMFLKPVVKKVDLAPLCHNGLGFPVPC